MSYYILDTNNNMIGGLYGQEYLDSEGITNFVAYDNTGYPVEVGDHWNGTSWDHQFTYRTVENLREQRDRILRETDHTQFPAYSGTATAAEWETFRQKLRDLPDTYVDGDEILIPANPIPRPAE
jgi:hypothetical protein